MKKVVLCLILSALFVFESAAQRFDFGIEFGLPFISPSFVTTKYSYLSDDPVSFDFAKIKQRTQIRPAMNFSGNYFAQVSYRMFAIRAMFSPISMSNTRYKVVFPDPVLGEEEYTSAILKFGCSGQLSLRYSFKTFQNKKISLIGGVHFFASYMELEESESMFFSNSELEDAELFKYMLWDDHRLTYGPQFGLEFSWLDKYRTVKKWTVIYNHHNKIGFGGFKVGTITVYAGLPTFKIFNSLKRNKIYIVK